MDKINQKWAGPLFKRIKERKPLIQILLGPRQVGKTTALIQLAELFPKGQVVMDSADDQQLGDSLWIERNWDKARRLTDNTDSDIVLILDEIQKIENWSETIKKLWDRDYRHHRNFKVILSGSSALNLQSGLSESLTGRFEIIPAIHCTYSDFKELTGRAIEEYIFFGGYPGSYQFIKEENRWRDYVVNSIIETTISRDILYLTRVDKPALLRRLFYLGCEFSGQILSYQKALGYLQDAGNTTTLAHYLNLLDKAFILSGLQKYDKKKFKLKASSPKYQVYNNALFAASLRYSFNQIREDQELWGRFVESSIGAHLINYARIEGYHVYYWRERNTEVDFIIELGKDLLAIEVKSGRRAKLIGLKKFKEFAPKAKTIIVGPDKDSLEDFLSNSPTHYF